MVSNIVRNRRGVSCLPCSSPVSSSTISFYPASLLIPAVVPVVQQTPGTSAVSQCRRQAITDILQNIQFQHARHRERPGVCDVLHIVPTEADDVSLAFEILNRFFRLQGVRITQSTSSVVGIQSPPDIRHKECLRQQLPQCVIRQLRPLPPVRSWPRLHPGLPVWPAPVGPPVRSSPAR